jgi:hypothetical protein
VARREKSELSGYKKREKVQILRMPLLKRPTGPAFGKQKQAEWP